MNLKQLAYTLGPAYAFRSDSYDIYRDLGEGNSVVVTENWIYFKRDDLIMEYHRNTAEIREQLDDLVAWFQKEERRKRRHRERTRAWRKRNWARHRAYERAYQRKRRGEVSG